MLLIGGVSICYILSAIVKGTGCQQQELIIFFYLYSRNYFEDVKNFNLYLFLKCLPLILLSLVENDVINYQDVDDYSVNIESEDDE